LFKEIVMLSGSAVSTIRRRRYDGSGMACWVWCDRLGGGGWLVAAMMVGGSPERSVILDALPLKTVVETVLQHKI
jgi:hypothetical protein